MKFQILAAPKPSVRVVATNITPNVATPQATESHAPNVRVVPIKLVDGKVIHRQTDESVQMKSEFTNFSHQEFAKDTSKTSSEPDMIIPRLDKDELNKENVKKVLTNQRPR